MKVAQLRTLLTKIRDKVKLLLKVEVLILVDSFELAKLKGLPAIS